MTWFVLRSVFSEAVSVSREYVQMCSVRFHVLNTVQSPKLGNHGTHTVLLSVSLLACGWPEAVGSPTAAVSSVVTGVKAFSCSVCSASFTTNGSLTRHMATHMSMRPYKCPFCDEGFRTAVHCKKHMKRHQTVPSAASAAAETEGGGISPLLLQGLLAQAASAAHGPPGALRPGCS